MSDVLTLEKLIGKWKLTKADESFDVEDGVEVIISPDGKLEYSIQSGAKKQIISLTFRLDGNLLISDQASSPREEQTQIMFDKDLLVFDYQGNKAWFEKVI
jgi:hypothetical protein